LNAETQLILLSYDVCMYVCMMYVYNAYICNYVMPTKGINFFCEKMIWIAIGFYFKIFLLAFS